MGRFSPLLQGTAVMTVFNLLLRVLGLFFQSGVAAATGAEGMGLLSLAMNVEALALTLATSGIHYSATRLLSEELGMGRRDRLPAVMRCCLGYALAFSLLSASLLFLFAPQLAAFTGEVRLAPALRCFALGLPFLSLNSVFSGCFTALLTPWKAGVSQIFEQVLMTVLTLSLLPRIPAGRPELCCAAVAFCGSAADLCSLLLSYILYRYPFRKRVDARCSARSVLPRLRRLSLPLALSSYARTALSSMQHLLVPKALRRSGCGQTRALSVYGTVTGMVFPVLGFASVFFSALSEMLIPQLTRAQMQGERAGMERSAGRILSACLIFSSFTALALYLLGPWLGLRLFRSAEAGAYIRVLAPLVTVMYLDSVVDGILKGLGLQFSSMAINLADAGLTLIAVCLLLPRWGLAAYIGILYLSECFNFLLSFLRLRKSLVIRFL